MRYTVAFLTLALASHAHAAVFELHPLLRSRIEGQGVIDLVWALEADDSTLTVPTTTPGLLGYSRWDSLNGGNISWKKWTSNGLYADVPLGEFRINSGTDFCTDGEMLYVKRQQNDSTWIDSNLTSNAFVFNFWDNTVDGWSGVGGGNFRVWMSGLETVQWGQSGEDAIAVGVAVTPFVVPEPSWVAFVLPLAGLASYRLRLR